MPIPETISASGPMVLTDPASETGVVRPSRMFTSSSPPNPGCIPQSTQFALPRIAEPSDSDSRFCIACGLPFEVPGQTTALDSFADSSSPNSPSKSASDRSLPSPYRRSHNCFIARIVEAISSFPGRPIVSMSILRFHLRLRNRPATNQRQRPRIHHWVCCDTRASGEKVS